MLQYTASDNSLNLQPIIYIALPLTTCTFNAIVSYGRMKFIISSFCSTVRTFRVILIMHSLPGRPFTFITDAGVISTDAVFRTVLWQTDIRCNVLNGGCYLVNC